MVRVSVRVSVRVTIYFEAVVCDHQLKKGV